MYSGVKNSSSGHLAKRTFAVNGSTGDVDTICDLAVTRTATFHGDCTLGLYDPERDAAELDDGENGTGWLPVQTISASVPAEFLAPGERPAARYEPPHFLVIFVMFRRLIANCGVCQSR